MAKYDYIAQALDIDPEVASKALKNQEFITRAFEKLNIDPDQLDLENLRATEGETFSLEDMKKIFEDAAKFEEEKDTPSHRME